MVIPTTNPKMVPLYFWLLILFRTSQANSEEENCTWAQKAAPDCEEFGDHFDPNPSVTNQKNGPGKKLNSYNSARQGLHCLQYDIQTSPKDARFISGDMDATKDPLTIKIEVEALELEELNAQKEELKLQKMLTLEWTDWRLKWPGQCNLTEDYQIDISGRSDSREFPGKIENRKFPRIFQISQEFLGTFIAL